MQKKTTVKVEQVQYLTMHLGNKDLFSQQQQHSLTKYLLSMDLEEDDETEGEQNIFKPSQTLSGKKEQSFKTFENQNNRSLDLGMYIDTAKQKVQMLQEYKLEDHTTNTETTFEPLIIAEFLKIHKTNLPQKSQKIDRNFPIILGTFLNKYFKTSNNETKKQFQRIIHQNAGNQSIDIRYINKTALNALFRSDILKSQMANFVNHYFESYLLKSKTQHKIYYHAKFFQRLKQSLVNKKWG